MTSAVRNLDGLRLSILGPVRAWSDDEEIELGPPQQRMCLAALALAPGRPVSSGRLVDWLWSEAPPSRAGNVVQTYVARLRRALSPRLIETVPGGYLLRLAPSQIDAASFTSGLEAARELAAAGDLHAARREYSAALALWTGTPFEGFDGTTVATERLRWERSRRTAVTESLGLAVDLGLPSQAVSGLQGLLDQDPLDEPVAVLLMRALSLAGHRAGALQVYADLRERLVSDLGLEPGPAARAAHHRVLTESGTPPVPLAGPEERPCPAVAQLPGVLADFTGRRDALRDAAEALAASSGDGPAVVVIVGAGGTGKTTLAVHAAHRVKAGYPGGQLYTDLRGWGGSPADPAEVLAGFLRALGVTDPAIPVSIADRAALFRSRLASRRILVVLDNARDAGQVEPLLPGCPTCGVLVTSRDRLASLPVTRRLTLGGFTEAEAIALLERVIGADRVGREPEQTRRLVRACGMLPLAVRVVASRLVARPAWRIAEVAELLASEETFRLAFSQLGPEQARAFELLSVAEVGDLPLGAAAAVLGRPADRAEDVLESLVDVHLLESPGPGRYSYHDLLRRYARDLAPARAEPLERLVEFWTSAARDAYRSLRPGHAVIGMLPSASPQSTPFTGPAEARSWGARELAGVLRLFRQLARAHPALADAAATMLYGFEPVFESSFTWRDIAELAPDLLRCAELAAGPRAEARLRYMLGGALMQIGRVPEARSEVSLGLTAAETAADPVILAQLLNVSGLLAVSETRWDSAERDFHEALSLNRAGNRSDEAKVLTNLAIAQHRQGRSDEAFDSARRALTIYEDLGDGMGQTHSLRELGRSCSIADRLDEAVEAHTRSLALSRVLRLEFFEAANLYDLAAAHHRAGRVSDAIPLARTAASLSDEVGLLAYRDLARDLLRQARA